MLPDSDHRPAAIPQMSVGFPVSLDVAPNLRLPPFIVTLRPRSMFWAGVPEAPIDKDCDALASEGDIGAPPRQPLDWSIQPVAKTAPMKNSTQGHLGVGVSRSLSSHPPRCCGVRDGALTRHKSRLACGRISICAHNTIKSPRPAIVLPMGRTNHIGSSHPVRVLDLFCGAGGLSEGFSQASDRFATVHAVEHDVAAAATYAENHGSAAVHAGSIEDWLKDGDVPPADVIIGGPPCQGFSALGKQDMRDHRNQLWLRYADTIRRAQPKYFVLENVPAFLTSEQLRRFKRQCQPRSRLGAYTFKAEILNAADFGAPQLRRRVILIGHHRDLPHPGFPESTHSPDSRLNLKDALTGLPEAVTRVDLPDEWVERWGHELPGVFRTEQLHLTRYYEDRSLERFAHVPPGGNRFDIKPELLPDCWKRHRTGSGDVMGRLRWDRPSVTIRTEFFKPEKGRYLHPTEHRALTHHEAARIQGFPDDYKWVGSKASIARQIGNAVPIPLARALGRHLARLI